jgi:hypothetical protein
MKIKRLFFHMPKSIFYNLFFFSFFIISTFTGAYLLPQDLDLSWPIHTDSLSLRITSLFGESRGDHFHNGVDISSDSENIYSVGEGTIVYSRYKTDNPFQAEFGSGNCIWINHGKGVLSAYYHLKDEREEGFLNKKIIKKDEIIAKTGNTGHSSGSHLHFIIATENGKKIINPLTVLSKIEDSKSPFIGSLILTNGENYTYINDGENINISRAFPITVNIHDTGEKPGQKRGVHIVEFSVNNNIVKKSKFDSISLEGQFWTNETGLKFDELYYKNNYYIDDINFRSGQNTIQVKAIDFSGNESIKYFTFNVNRIK